MRNSADVDTPILTLLMIWAMYHLLRLRAQFKPRHPSATQIAADTAGTGNPPGG